MRVEEALKQIRSDWRYVRKAVGMKRGQHELTPELMYNIPARFYSMNERKARKYAYYDLAHQFVVKHIIETLKKRINLTRTEQEIVAGTLGKVFYNPPAREHVAMADSFTKLSLLGKRGEEIHDAIVDELSVLSKKKSQISSTGMFSDMFSNAIRRHWLWGWKGFVSDMDWPDDLKGLAAARQEHAQKYLEEARQGKSGSFYE